MRWPPLVALLARSKSGSPQDVHAQRRDWVRLIVTLGGMACLLSSPSRSQELPSQGIEAASEQQAFNNVCRTCHTIENGDNRLGPNLYNIIGRKAGSLRDYNYSSAMKSAGFIWDEKKLEHFIASPDEVVPGNNMKPYSGLASAEDRKKVVSFLVRAR